MAWRTSGSRLSTNEEETNEEEESLARVIVIITADHGGHRHELATATEFAAALVESGLIKSVASALVSSPGQEEAARCVYFAAAEAQTHAALQARSRRAPFCFSCGARAWAWAQLWLRRRPPNARALRLLPRRRAARRRRRRARLRRNLTYSVTCYMTSCCIPCAFQAAGAVATLLDLLTAPNDSLQRWVTAALRPLVAGDLEVKMTCHNDPVS